MTQRSGIWNIDFNFILNIYQFTSYYIYFRQDYYTRGRTIPGLDENQNYQLVYASEIGGYTELMFHRPRNTNDNDDIQFEVRLNDLKVLLSSIFET